MAVQLFPAVRPVELLRGHFGKIDAAHSVILRDPEFFDRAFPQREGLLGRLDHLIQFFLVDAFHRA